MADRDHEARLRGELGELGLPHPDPVAVRAAGISGDHQTGGVGVTRRPHGLPPRPDRRHREHGGVTVVADRHPSFVRTDVVDAVGDGLGHFGIGEVVNLHPLGFTLSLELLATVGVVAHELLLLFRVDRNHRFAGLEMPDGLTVEVPELAVTVRVLVALHRLGRRLQREPQHPKQLTHQRRRRVMTGIGQRPRQLPSRLRRPPQRRHRITTRPVIDHLVEHHQQIRIQVDLAFAATTGSPHPIRRDRPARQLSRTHDQRVPGQARRLRHPPLTTPPEHAHHRCPHEPSLALIQQRQH